MLLVITKLNLIEIITSKALINLYINHEKFLSVTNVLKAYNETKKEIKNSDTSVEYKI